jgi:segregation and condensation protein A
MPLAGAAPPLVQLPAFEGPLDLLLHLVRQGRMDIFDLPMVTLCDQYLVHIRAMENLDLSVAGEFFVMAATLLEIKSRMLLPAPPKEETEDGDEGEIEDPRAALVRQLLEYGRFQAIADALRDREGERQRLFFREPTGYSPEYALPPKFGELSADALLRTLERMLAELDGGSHSVTSVRRQKITLKMTMRLVLGQARAAGDAGILLSDLLPAPPYERLEIVLLFLSLLELLKQDQIRVFQEDFCGDIRVLAHTPADSPAPEGEGVGGRGDDA